MKARALLVAVAALLLAGACGERPVTPVGEDTWADPVDLVGMWQVVADGEEPGTWLRLDGGGLVLVRESDVLTGSWTADERHVLVNVDGSSGPPPADLEPAWLVGAHRYRAVDEGWQLENIADGDVVATLTAADAPDHVGTDWYAEPPEVTEEVRAALAPPAPLPEGAEPATAMHLVGRWVPAGRAVATDPHVVFDDDGTWVGSDGCNGVGGRWAVTDGQLLTLDGPMTLIACPGAPVGGWVGGAAHAVVDGQELVLVGAEGGQLGRLVRG